LEKDALFLAQKSMLINVQLPLKTESSINLIRLNAILLKNTSKQDCANNKNGP
jgi:hypothetical protein